MAHYVFQVDWFMSTLKFLGFNKRSQDQKSMSAWSKVNGYIYASQIGWWFRDLCLTGLQQTKLLKGQTIVRTTKKKQAKSWERERSGFPYSQVTRKFETLLQVEVTPIPTPKEGAAGAEHAAAVGDTQFESEDGRWQYRWGCAHWWANGKWRAIFLTKGRANELQGLSTTKLMNSSSKHLFQERIR